ncbi:MAG: hypothetical protein LCH83_01185 [Proteobacteria bacterium]|nr:hypothetical protein [Pseudomonadota bacterium]
MNDDNAAAKLPYEVKTFFQFLFKKHPATGWSLFVLTSCVLLYLFKFLFPEAIKAYFKNMDSLAITIFFAIGIIALVIWVTWSFWMDSQKQIAKTSELEKNSSELREKLSALNNKTESIDEHFKRFEHLFKHEPRVAIPNYVFVDFEPTIKSRGSSDSSAVGPAMEVLAEVFGRSKDYELQNGNICNNWEDLPKKLERFDGKSNFDSIVATPMYELRDRKRDFDFCSPIFYADISAYTQKDSKAFRDYISENKLNDATHCCSEGTFDKLKEYIEGKDLLLKGVKGELNYFLLAKYSKKSQNGESNQESHNIKTPEGFIYHPDKCINGLIYDEDNKEKREKIYSSDIFFAERVIVERTSAFKLGKIVSLLKPRQLLFPLCFAVKKGEDTLRKFINLGILNLQAKESKKYSGMSKLEELLIDGLKDLPMFKDFTNEDAIKYFRNDAEIFHFEEEKIDNVVNLRN